MFQLLFYCTVAAARFFFFNGGGIVQYTVQYSIQYSRSCWFRLAGGCMHFASLTLLLVGKKYLVRYLFVCFPLLRRVCLMGYYLIMPLFSLERHMEEGQGESRRKLLFALVLLCC